MNAPIDSELVVVIRLAKSRMRKSHTSGSVRGGGSNPFVYSTSKETIKIVWNILSVPNSNVLNLPAGISLAATEKGQADTASMGNIRGQEKKTASWIVKGDASGTYRLSADFTGTLMPFAKSVRTRFETENEFRVDAGEGLHIIVRPERSAFIGENYYMQFEIRNESSHPL